MRGNKSILILTHQPNYDHHRPFKTGLVLSQMGYNVSIFIPHNRFFVRSNKKRINEKLILHFCPTIFSGGFSKGADPIDLIARLYFIRKLKFDVIYAFDTRPAVILPAVYAKSIRRVPLLIDKGDLFGRGGTIEERSGRLYRALFSRIETFFEEYFLKYADAITVICRSIDRRLKDLGIHKETFLFQNGCDSLEVKRNVSVKQLREKLKLPISTPTIGFVGSLLPSDAELLFRSFKELQKKIPASLLLIGCNSHEGKYAMPEYVLTTGELSKREIQEYIYCCDLMVLPLRNNIANNGRWPSKINDYLTMGKPVVSTEIEVVKDLFKISEFGILAKDNEFDFADKIQELLLNDQSRAVFGKNAEALSKRLEWKTLVEHLILAFPNYF